MAIAGSTCTPPPVLDGLAPLDVPLDPPAAPVVAVPPPVSVEDADEELDDEPDEELDEELDGDTDEEAAALSFSAPAVMTTAKGGGSSEASRVAVVATAVWPEPSASPLAVPVQTA